MPLVLAYFEMKLFFSPKQIFWFAFVNIFRMIFEHFPDVNAAYSDFINKLMSIIHQMAPFKEVCVKNRTEEWFDGEVAASIKGRDKLFKKFKNSKLLVNW